MPCKLVITPTPSVDFPTGEQPQSNTRFSVVGANATHLFYAVNDRFLDESKLYRSPLSAPDMTTAEVLDSSNEGLMAPFMQPGGLVAPRGKSGVVIPSGGSDYTAEFYTNFSGEVGTLSIEDEGEEVFPSGQMWGLVAGTLVGFSVVGELVSSDPDVYEYRLWLTVLDLKSQTLVGKWDTGIAFNSGTNETFAWNLGLKLGANRRFYFAVPKSAPTIAEPLAAGIYSFTIGDAGMTDLQLEYLFPDETGAAFDFMPWASGELLVAYKRPGQAFIVIVKRGEDPVNVPVPEGYEIRAAGLGSSVMNVPYQEREAVMAVVVNDVENVEAQHLFFVRRTGEGLGLSDVFNANVTLGTFIPPRVQDPAGVYWQTVLRRVVPAWLEG